MLICTIRFGLSDDLGKNETTNKTHIKTKVRVTMYYFVTGKYFLIAIIQLLKGFPSAHVPSDAVSFLTFQATIKLSTHIFQ